MRLFAILLALFAAIPSSASGQQIRIGVLGLYHPSQLELRAAENASLTVVIGKDRLELRPGLSEDIAKLSISASRVLLVLHGHEYIGSELRAWSTDSFGFFVLAVPGRINRKYQGLLSIKATNGELAPVVSMDLETAVAAVVQAESAPKAPLEALKAQAVATRSYFAAGRGRHESFDFCDLTHCQVMRGSVGADSLATKAASETQGLVLAYQGTLFAAMFTRSCGGRTRTNSEDRLPGGGYPYFAVRCGYCQANPVRWTRMLSVQDAATAAKGEAGRLAVNRKLGWNAIPSNSFIARAEADGTILQGTGQGHGIGLCQRGAMAMADTGADFRTILRYYFPNTTLLNLGEVRRANSSRR